MCVYTKRVTCINTTRVRVSCRVFGVLMYRTIRVTTGRDHTDFFANVCTVNGNGSVVERVEKTPL